MLLAVIPQSYSQESPSAESLAQNYPSTAQATIELVFGELFVDLDGLLKIYDESMDSYYAEIDKTVSPWIDYDSFAKGVMGRKYYTMATEQQRGQFRDVFQQSLVKTYGKSLLGVDEPRFEVDPPETTPAPGASVQVRQTLFSGTGHLVLIYSMGQAEDGRWRVRNVILEGINLGKTFRNQFARAAQEYSEDLDLVIENWSPEA